MPFFVPLLIAAAKSAAINTAVSAAQSGVNWLWSKAFPPDPPEAPKRSQVLKSKRQSARWIHGEKFKTEGKLVYRSTIPPKSRGTGGTYKDNHFRMFFVVSEGSLGELHQIEIEDHGLIDLEKVTEGGPDVLPAVRERRVRSSAIRYHQARVPAKQNRQVLAGQRWRRFGHSSVRPERRRHGRWNVH